MWPAQRTVTVGSGESTACGLPVTFDVGWRQDSTEIAAIIRRGVDHSELAARHAKGPLPGHGVTTDSLSQECHNSG